MTYREHVHRVLAKHHARLEIGLSQARKQARFVERISDILYKNHVPEIQVIIRLGAMP